MSNDLITKRNMKGQIESIESTDWWIARRGGHGAIDSEDLKSIAGDIRLDYTPYPTRLVGYGSIPDFFEPDTLARDAGGGAIIPDARAEEYLNN